MKHIRWEYLSLMLNESRLDEIDDKLNRYGVQGWELIAIRGNNLAIFKRQVPS